MSATGAVDERLRVACQHPVLRASEEWSATITTTRSATPKWHIATAWT